MQRDDDTDFKAVVALPGAGSSGGPSYSGSHSRVSRKYHPDPKEDEALLAAAKLTDPSILNDYKVLDGDSNFHSVRELYEQTDYTVLLFIRHLL
jgi:hypothetical protein